MVGYDRAHELGTGIYGLKDLERVWQPRKGYVFISEKYPEGVPRTMGRFTVGVPPSAAATARALESSIPSSRAAAMLITSGIPAITAGNIIRDPQRVEEILTGGLSAVRSYGAAASGVAAGGTALARGGPSVGTAPALGGIGGDIATTGKGLMDTAMEYAPLAIKIIIAVIVVKIALGLVRGRK